MIRLFIGLPIETEAAVKIKSVYDYLSGHDFLLKPVSQKNYHITIKFLGECDGNIANSIEKNFNNIDIKPDAIPYTIAGIGAFPDIKRASVIWCGLKTDMNRINQVHDTIDKFTKQFGFKKDKEGFTPHLTVARLRKGRRLTGDIIKYIEENKNTLYGDSFFKKIVLYSSRLTPDGPVYTGMKEILFK